MFATDLEQKIAWLPEPIWGRRSKYSGETKNLGVKSPADEYSSFATIFENCDFYAKVYKSITDRC